MLAESRVTTPVILFAPWLVLADGTRTYLGVRTRPGQVNRDRVKAPYRLAIERDCAGGRAVLRRCRVHARISLESVLSLSMRPVGDEKNSPLLSEVFRALSRTATARLQSGTRWPGFAFIPSAAPSEWSRPRRSRAGATVTSP